jgi:formate hydrogenlyase subunit 3/multisubunit Na+/H+ antiporter MnhD subunit
MRRVYLILSIAGFVIPYYFLVTFLLENGFDLSLILNQLFANRISTFFAVDLILTAIVFLIYSFTETRTLKMKNWSHYLLATLLIGPSFALPFFLYNLTGWLDITTNNPEYQNRSAL